MSSRAEIERLTAKFAKAVTEKDIAALGSFYEEGARFLPPGAPTAKGPVAIQAAQQKIMEAGVQTLTLQAEDIIEAGDFIIEIGRVTATIKPRGMMSLIALLKGRTKFTIHGKSVVVWRRQMDGSLKIAVDTFNSDARGF
jgi:ketosteroid isomerase-like protein